MTGRAIPLDYVCPYCGADVGEPCPSRRGRRGEHPERHGLAITWNRRIEERIRRRAAPGSPDEMSRSSSK